MRETPDRSFDECAWALEIPGYLLGEPQDKTGMDWARHFEECFRCREQLEEMRATMDALRRIEPPPEKDLSRMVRERISRASQERRRFARKAALCAAVWILAPIAVWGLWLCLLVPEGRRDEPASQGPASAADAAISEEQNSPIVADSLRWFAENQEADGSWNPEKWGGERDYTVALTALTLLAFYESRTPSPTVPRGIVYLLSRQTSEGLLGSDSERALYNHGIATLALLHAYDGGHRPKELEEPIRKALDYICRQQKLSGGWGYRSGDANISVSFWQMQALMFARGCGWHHARNSIDRGLAWIDSLTDERGCVGYSKANDFPYGFAASTAMGAVLFRSDGADRTLENLPQSRMVEDILAGSPDGGRAWDYYQKYFVCKALLPDRAGEVRKSGEALAARQIQSGIHRGTWAPDDRWGKAGGRLYSTALAVLTLLLP